MGLSHWGLLPFRLRPILSAVWGCTGISSTIQYTSVIADQKLPPNTSCLGMIVPATSTAYICCLRRNICGKDGVCPEGLSVMNGNCVGGMFRRPTTRQWHRKDFRLSYEKVFINVSSVVQRIFIFCLIFKLGLVGNCYAQ